MRSATRPSGNFDELVDTLLDEFRFIEDLSFRELTRFGKLERFHDGNTFEFSYKGKFIFQLHLRLRDHLTGAQLLWAVKSEDPYLQNFGAALKRRISDER